MTTDNPPQKHINTPRQVLFVGLVGTAVEFFDFYIYATAAPIADQLDRVAACAVQRFRPFPSK
jgi:hypothetical protein